MSLEVFLWILLVVGVVFQIVVLIAVLRLAAAAIPYFDAENRRRAEAERADLQRVMNRR